MPEMVGNMCHAELAAWIDSVLLSMGIKPESDKNVIISKRLPRPKATTTGIGTKDSAAADSKTPV